MRLISSLLVVASAIAVVFAVATATPKEEDIRDIGIGTEVQSARAAAITALAKRLGIGAAEIEVLSMDEQNWPDTSLGCPEEGKFYLQVVTPGYALQLRAKGQVYEYHVDESAKVVVVCRKSERGQK